MLDTLAKSAAQLCEAEIVNIWRPTGGSYRLAASYGVESQHEEWLAYRDYLADVAYTPGKDTVVGRILLDGKTVQIDDIRSDPEYDQRGALAGVRTLLGVPLLRDGNPIGVMVLVRATVRQFTSKQVELIEAFADQAVIAIENVRLFDAVQARTRELTEALEQQTATSEVLRVISSSPTDIQPVLDAVGESAARLCEATNAVIFRLEGDILRQVASYGGLPTSSHPPAGLPVNRSRVTGRAVFERRTIHVDDLAAEESEFPEGSREARRDGHRTTLATPLLREGVPIGAILIRRMEVRPFTPKQIELLNTFADQAVIAIENVRLFDEVQARTEDLPNRCNSRPPPPTCSRSSAARRSIFSRCSTRIVETAARLCEAEMRQSSSSYRMASTT